MPPETPTAMTTPAESLTPSSGSASFNKEIKLISHSSLFYWWPVWVFGYFLALWTFMEDHRLVVVPKDGKVDVMQTKDDTTYNLRFSTKTKYDPNNETVKTPDKDVRDVFKPRVSARSWLGSLYIFVLVLTVAITNVPLRGLLSFFVIAMLIVVALVISLFHWWDNFYDLLGGLHVFINMAGYIFLSTTILVLWLSAILLFDRRNYIIFTPGQVKVCEHIGGSVRTYDTVGITFEKQRDDLFRHIILGFGSGDLIVRTSGAERHEIKISNVLMIGSKLKAVEDLLRERAVA